MLLPYIELSECARICQHFNTLPCRQLPLAVLCCYPSRSTAGLLDCLSKEGGEERKGERKKGEDGRATREQVFGEQTKTIKARFFKKGRNGSDSLGKQGKQMAFSNESLRKKMVDKIVIKLQRRYLPFFHNRVWHAPMRWSVPAFAPSLTHSVYICIGQTAESKV